MKITREELDKMLDTLARSLSISEPIKTTKDIYFQALSSYSKEVIMKALLSVAASYKPRRIGDFPVLSDIFNCLFPSPPPQYEHLGFDCKVCENTGFIYKWIQSDRNFNPTYKDGNPIPEYKLKKAANSPDYSTKYFLLGDHPELPETNPPLTPCVVRCECSYGKTRRETGLSAEMEKR